MQTIEERILNIKNHFNAISRELNELLTTYDPDILKAVSKSKRIPNPVPPINLLCPSKQYYTFPEMCALYPNYTMEELNNYDISARHPIQKKVKGKNTRLYLNYSYTPEMVICRF